MSVVGGDQELMLRMLLMCCVLAVALHVAVQSWTLDICRNWSTLFPNLTCARESSNISGDYQQRLCRLVFYSGPGLGYSNQVIGMEYAVALSKAVNCSIAAASFSESGIDTLLHNASRSWDFTSILDTTQHWRTEDGGKGLQADVCPVIASDTYCRPASISFSCTKYNEYTPDDTQHTDFDNLVDSLKEYIAGQPVVTVGLPCAYSMACMFPHKHGAMKPAQKVLDIAESIITAQLGGKQRYISAHVRRGDFSVICNGDLSTWRPCSLNMSALPAQLASAAADAEVDTVFITSNGHLQELTDLKHSLIALMRLQGIEPRVIVPSIDQAGNDDPFQQVLLDQLVLGCGKGFLGTWGSTFSHRALKLSPTMDCHPNHLGDLSTL